jgi:large subunit ribosomal protein L22
MEAKASLMFAKISTRKVRMVLDMVRGQQVAEAIDQLRFTHKAAAPLVSKLLGSAISNAQQKDEKVDLDRLYVKTAYADEAPNHMMVRWRPRAMGRATQVQKGMSHITVVVAERES